MDLPEFFGLDIGNHSVKVAEVRRRGERPELKSLASISNSMNLLEDTSEAGLQQLADLIKQARTAARISTVNCVAALPETPVFSRLISIPKIQGEKLEEAVHWELKTLIPVPLDEVNIAFLEIGEKQTPAGVMLDIYVAAAPKAFTERFVKLAELAGINLIALETESLANTRSVMLSKPEGDVFIVDFGANSTDFVLSRNGVPVFTQTISTGSDAFTKAIAGDYGIDLQRAEQYKRAYGLDPTAGEGKIAKSIEPIIQIVVTEIGKIITYVQQRLGELQSPKMVITGDGASLLGLPKYLTDKLGVESTKFNLASHLQLSGDLATEAEATGLAGYSIAIGLALKDS
jgi:type IV pilus assembly protein PilM